MTFLIKDEAIVLRNTGVRQVSGLFSFLAYILPLLIGIDLVVIFTSQVSADGAIVFGENTISSPGVFDSSDLANPIIAPFWDNSNIRINGNIYYRISKSLVDLERITATVRQSTATKKDFAASWCMVVTWYKVAETSGSPAVVSIILSFKILHLSYILCCESPLFDKS